MTTTLNQCPSTTFHGTYWAYSKHGCRCLKAALEESIYRTRRRRGNPIELVRDATGASRTAQGLAHYGYTAAQIAEASGLSERTINHLCAGKPTIRVSKDRALRAAADRLIAAPQPTGWSASMARSTARRNGWVPLHAWDDDTIDDPDAQPNLGHPSESDAFDPITVALAVDGRLTHAQLATHWPDLLETVRRLAKRMTDVEIALHLRWPGYDDGPPGKTRGQNNVGQLRLRNGIPGPAKFEAVHAYPTRRPDAKRRRRAEQAAS